MLTMKVECVHVQELFMWNTNNIPVRTTPHCSTFSPMFSLFGLNVSRANKWHAKGHVCVQWVIDVYYS